MALAVHVESPRGEGEVTLAALAVLTFSQHTASILVAADITAGDIP